MQRSWPPPVPMTVSVCLLGLVEEIVPTSAHRTLLNILLFYAIKAIILHLKKPTAPRGPSGKA